MEILIELPKKRPKLKVALFDFDGTLSTLRHGWEGIMEPLVLEMISGGGPVDDSLIREVKDYIDASAGIQTIYQMQWLAQAVKRHCKNPGAPGDPWWYKAEYNKRLLQLVDGKKCDVLSGRKPSADSIISGWNWTKQEAN